MPAVRGLPSHCSADLTDTIDRLASVKAVLHQLLDVRGYHESTSQAFDKQPIVGLQEKLGRALAKLSGSSCVLVALSNVSSVREWLAWVDKAGRDHTRINLIDPDPAGEKVIRAEERADAWLEDAKRLRDTLMRYDVFLSYASPNEAEAREITDAVQSAGGRVFLSPKNLMPGVDFAEEIRMALVASRQLWLLVSPDSLASPWVISEWGAAWVLGKPIIPILFKCAPADLPDRIARLHYLDFSCYRDLVRRSFS